MVCTDAPSLLKTLTAAKRIWTVPAIHGNLDKLLNLHDAIYEHFECGDQIIYHGNYIGHGPNSLGCLNEILTFRRLVLSIPGVRPSDFTYLKGSQEDLLGKLYQLPFSPDPTDAYLWMLSNGVAQTLQSYGVCHHDGIEACCFGTVGLTRWINSIRDVVRSQAGHEYFLASLKRAAFTPDSHHTPMLFVHSGINHANSLEDQGDAFYWGWDGFKSLNTAYKPFDKVVRGFDPHHDGATFNGIKATIDDGCGFGGDLISASFGPNGQVEHVLSA